ncbi:SRPBCC domain-containing protein [Nocardioides sp. T5]|uniref:SRPBCC family protein n=1 Tax=Nocardioides sp. T5 TaxID=3400182 RepID=UPI003A88FE35
MQIDNEFQVQAPPGEVWDYLQRTEDVVECIPGAAILEKVSEDEYRGQVTVKLGPLAVVLQGMVTIDERDHAGRTMKLTGRAKDTKGRGATDAGVVVDVVAAGEGTRVTLVSDIKITGKIAQFGRGVMKDVSQRIADEFARNLEARLTGPVAPTAGPATAPDAGPDAVAGAEPGTPAPAPRAVQAPADSGPRHAATPGQAAPSVGGIRLVAGALVRALGAAIGSLFRKLVKPFAGDKGGRR